MTQLNAIQRKWYERLRQAGKLPVGWDARRKNQGIPRQTAQALQLNGFLKLTQEDGPDGKETWALPLSPPPAPPSASRDEEPLRKAFRKLVDRNVERDRAVNVLLTAGATLERRKRDGRYMTGWWRDNIYLGSVVDPVMAAEQMGRYAQSGTFRR